MNHAGTVHFHFTQAEAMSSIDTIAVMTTLIHSLAIQCDDAFMVNNELAATHCNPLVVAFEIAFAFLHKALFLAAAKPRLCPSVGGMKRSATSSNYLVVFML